jgi:cytochrome c biogenesis protein CcdA/thiol-disulfide isomerase/thioredoxin
MSVLFVVAVVGGAVSVLTPCVLPLLPAILVISRDGGRSRAWGIAAGIELSFFVLALLLAGAITALGLPANTLRWVAAVLLAAFGLVLIVPKLDEAFSVVVSKLTSRVPQASGTRSGFVGGFLSGVPLGLVWAPCAGPILAGITVAASAQRFTSRTVVTMLGYALGMFFPLAAVIIGGQRLGQGLRRVLGGGRRVLAPMGVILLATSVLIGVGGLDRVNRFIAEHIDLTSTPTAALEQRALTDAAKAPSTTGPGVDPSRYAEGGYPETDELTDLGPAPELSGISRWYNSPERTIRGLRGKVVLIDFWTYSCINCIRTLPRLRAWDAKYRSDGLVIVGVHSPEFEFEKDPGNVGRAVREFDIEYPVALDPNMQTWRAFFNHYWPAHYLIDKTGRIRSVHYGEGEYRETENEIRELLGERGDAEGMPDDELRPLTPETYLGYLRAERFTARDVSARGNLVHNERHTYEPPKTAAGDVDVPNDVWALSGQWTVGSEASVAGEGASIYIRFRAAKVHIVAGPTGDAIGRIDPSVYSGGRDVKVDEYKLYTVRDGPEANALLRLDVSPGVAVFAFTFG